MEKIDELSKFLEEHVDEERVRDALMAAKIDEMSIQIQTLTKQVESLITTWNQTKGVVSFVKWIVGISGSVGAFILFVKDHLK